MLGRTTAIGAALLAGGALCLTGASGRPAAARTQPDLEGSYLGTFITQEGNLWQGDLTISQQVGAHVAGMLDVAAIHQGVLVSGSISTTNRLLISGRTGGLGQPLSRIKIHAVYRPDADPATGTIQGTYLVTGATRDRGSFTLHGGRTVRR